MTKNNHDVRQSLLARVQRLEALVDGLEAQDHTLLDMINRKQASVEAHIAEVESRLAAHQMDTPLARLKRWWRRR